jgi:hypothetical protein
MYPLPQAIHSFLRWNPLDSLDLLYCYIMRHCKSVKHYVDGQLMIVDWYC